MGTYLVVANRTALSVELTEGLKTIKLRDPLAEFTLLVPATPAMDVAGRQTDLPERAQATVTEAKKVFERNGLSVVDAHAGDGLPLKAIDDEFQSGRRIYNGIVVSSLPPDVSNWLGQDLLRRIEHRWGLPVRHIVASIGLAPERALRAGPSEPGPDRR